MSRDKLSVGATRDALLYERQVVEQKLKANRRIAKQATNYERKLTDERVKDAIAFRENTIKYERQITDAGFKSNDSLLQAHADAHEREHQLNEAAIDKAATALGHQIQGLADDFNRMREMLPGYMTTERFEREHKSFIERVDTKFETYDQKISAEEKVTVRQDTTQAVLDNLAANRRWLYGVLISIFATFALTAAHILGIVK